MPTVILKFKENTINEFPLKKGDTLTVGRLNDNQIVVENLAVSGHHAKVDSVGEGYLLTDLQSKNGTFVNQQKIASHWLKHGDVVTIGKHTLVFSNENDTGAAPGQGASEMEKTMVMDTAAHREMLAKSASATAAEIPAGGAGGRATLTYIAGGEGEVSLTRKLIKIGKATTNDIVAKGFLVGQTAATISKRPKGFYLGYVSGFTKPKVNGAAVKESVQLQDYDTIEIGAVKLQFNDGSGQ